MLTTALLVPPLVAVVLWQAPFLLRDPRALLGSLGAVFLPLASYLYIYQRGAQHPEWWGNGDWTSAQEWFWSFVSTAQGREELAWGFEPGRAFFGNGFPEMIWQEMSVLLLIGGLAWQLVPGGAAGLPAAADRRCAVDRPHPDLPCYSLARQEWTLGGACAPARPGDAVCLATQ
jgi:hypothetical protein